MFYESLIFAFRIGKDLKCLGSVEQLINAVNVKIEVWTERVRVWPSRALYKTDFNKQRGREGISLAEYS